jgi:hemerythrin-like domain-containing protein
MNKLVHELKHDHNAIMQVTRGMNAAADLLDSNAQLEPSVISSFVQFLRVFAGQCHNEKEEMYLFPLLAAKGNVRANQEIEALERDHRIAVQLVDELASLSIAYSKHPPVVPSKLAPVLRSLAELYSSRIWIEDYMLFPIAEQAVSESEHQLLRKQFKQVEAVIGTDVHKAFEILAGKLEALIEYRNEYPVSPAA